METPSLPCANHPAPATFTCARCGSFACEACRSPQAAGTWCVSCGARYATPGQPVGEVLSDTFGFLVRYPAPIAVFAGFHVLFGLAELPFNMDMQEALEAGQIVPFMSERLSSWLAVMLGGSIFSALASALFIRFTGDALEGPRRPFGDLVSAALRRALPVFGTSLLLSIVLGVGFLLCLAPGIFLAVALALTLPATVLQPVSPLESVSFSWTHTQGHRGNLFLLLLILTLILVSMGMVGALVTFLMKPLGLGGMVVGTAVSQGLNGTGIALLLVLLVCCYLRLTGRWLPPSVAR
ncbi:hypothetical protein F0U60_37060 [Archangium minus]|uniref:B box-type domain-containing protein n=1 Tax=Archangium minus TaxID=83450 RepID=A0ABY9X141_9BACT|nr:hypothetical protein F0U60_37060 [Archangium minus]